MKKKKLKHKKKCFFSVTLRSSKKYTQSFPTPREDAVIFRRFLGFRERIRRKRQSNVHLRKRTGWSGIRSITSRTFQGFTERIRRKRKRIAHLRKRTGRSGIRLIRFRTFQGFTERIRRKRKRIAHLRKRTGRSGIRLIRFRTFQGFGVYRTLVMVPSTPELHFASPFHFSISGTSEFLAFANAHFSKLRIFKNGYVPI